MNIKTVFFVLVAVLLASCGGNTVKLVDSHTAKFSTSSSSDNIFAMQLDGNGYLWIGTDRGVEVYDGTNYRLLSHDKNDTTSLRSNNVVGIFKDKDNEMWVMTDGGVDRYLGNGMFKHYSSDAVIHSAECMSQTDSGGIVALYGGELCKLVDGTFKSSCKIVDSYFENGRTALYKSGDGRFLVNTNVGVFIIDRDLRHFKRMSVPRVGSVVTCADDKTICLLSFNEGVFFLDRRNLSVKSHLSGGMPAVAENSVLWHGKLFFTGHDGVYSLDDKTHSIYSLSQDFQDDLSPEFIQDLYVDPDNVLWIGYNRRFSIKKIQSLNKLEAKLRRDKVYGIFDKHGVVAVTQDGNGNVFGALDNDSIFCIDKTKDGVVAAAINAFIPVHSRQHVKSVYYSAGYFWVTTTSNVLAFKYNQGFQLDEFYDMGLTTNNVCGMSVPISNGLAVLGSNTIVVFDATHNTSAVNDTRRTANDQPVVWRRGKFTVKVYPLKASQIPLGSQLVNLGNNRLLTLFQNDQPYVINLNNGKVSKSSISLQGGLVSFGRYGNHTYIGTDNGLSVYDSNSGRLSTIPEFGNKPINNILATANGVVVTCEGNIISFDPATRHLHTIWQGSSEKDFQPYTLAMATPTRLFAATRDGFKKYDVMHKQKGEVRPKLFIESVDAVMSNDTHRSCKLYDADSATTVVLSHTENTFKIAFSAITPSLSEKYTYSYRLKGYDNDWQQSDESDEVEYARVKPGKYRFEISCTDQQRPWITVSKSLTIRVKPHPLLSGMAITIYVILAALAVFFANRLYIRMRMVRINADNAAKEKDREQYVNKMNMAFFANISHEFRNPITMIAGPVSQLRKAPELSKQSNNMVRLISQSAKMLLKLVNQMLDFNLLEGDAMRLSVKRIDVAAIIAEYSHHYEVSAAEKGINIINIGTDKPVVMLADEDKIIKIFDNLMSNAVKHTPQNGVITVSLKSSDDAKLILSVENTGSHIPATSLTHIFERYYQAPNDVANWGVGLGLHYVKSLVKLHHGSISASNTDNGVRFSVSLPMRDEAYSLEDRKPREQQQQIPEAFADDDILRPRQTINDDKRRTLLVVEKDVNTSYFLRKIFENVYNVVNRYDAEAVISDIADIKPDIIVSCVMLDGKSGLDLCRELRANELYKDIPFIFLTTCNSGDQQAEGMKAGADAYVTKPFDPEYLREVVGKALGKADEYKQLLQRLPQPQQEVKGDGLSSKDKEMLRVIRKFMKDNIDDGDLDVDKLGRKLLLSRTKLYEKIKELTGKTPNELFRTYKLSYAAELLKEGKLNVSEVAERSGFSSVAFFSRTFKKYYGVSPKDYD